MQMLSVKTKVINIYNKIEKNKTIKEHRFI